MWWMMPFLKRTNPRDPQGKKKGSLIVMKLHICLQLIRQMKPPVWIFLETGKKKNTLKRGGEGLTNEMQAVKLKYSFWLRDSRQRALIKHRGSLSAIWQCHRGQREACEPRSLPPSLKQYITTNWHRSKSRADRVTPMGQKTRGKGQKYQHPSLQMLRAKNDEGITQPDPICDWIFPQLFLHRVW